MRVTGVLLLLNVTAAANASQGPPPMDRPPSAIAAIAAEATRAREAENLPEAVRQYKKAVALAPGWTEGWWFLGTIAYDGDKYVECRDAFKRFTALQPKMTAGYAMLGLCEFQTKEFPASLAHLEKAFALGLPAHEELSRVTILHAAMLHVKAHNYERALLLTSVLVRQFDDPAIIAVMGIAQLREPWFPQEVPVADRELVMDLGRAFALQAERKIAESLTLYIQIVEAHPKRPNLHFAYASTLAGSEPERGMEVMKQELAIVPDHVPALVSLAAYYLKSGQVETAKPYAERAARAAPDNFAARGTLGRVLVELGQLPAAIVELETAERLAPDSPEVHFSLATAYSRTGREADAAKQRAEFARLKKLQEQMQESGAGPDTARK